MDRLTLLQAFARTAHHGSLTAAANELGVRPSTVSKWLRELEDTVGSTLLDRTTRSVRLTEAGRLLRGPAERLVADWDEALGTVRSHEQVVRGRLVVSAPAVFGERHVSPHLATFLAAHPLVALDLRLSDRFVDLVGDGFDVALRLGQLPDSTLRSRRLAITPRWLVGAPSLLAERGEPAHPDELASWPCLVHPGVPRATWTVRCGDERVAVSVTGRVRVDHSETLRQLAVAGLGVAMLADWLVADDLARGTLVRLLPAWTCPDAPVWAMLPPQRRVPVRVQRFLDHLAEAWATPLARDASSSAPGSR